MNDADGDSNREGKEEKKKIHKPINLLSSSASCSLGCGIFPHYSLVALAIVHLTIRANGNEKK